MDAVVGKVFDLVEKAGKFFIKKYKSIKDFDKNLETLERNVKQLSDIAVDMKTEVENQERSGKKKRKLEVESWFDEVEQIEAELRVLKEQVTRGKKNVGALKKMNGRVGELLEQCKHFGTLVDDVYEREEYPLLAPQVHEETSKQNIEVILTWLHDENVSSIGIYGMGGVGKTTLAKHIHNRLLEDNHLLEERPYQVHWVTVSQGYTIKGLQDDLAKVMNLDLSNEEDEHRRTAKLNRAFKNMNNIVIILDDVWDRLCLEKLGYPLGVEGCKLIVTTRSYEVCQKMGCQKLREVKKLNTDDAWELFRTTLRCETPLSPDIEPIAKFMAGKCKGLPLGLITLAGSMRGVTDIREWENARKEFPYDMESDVFKILQYSYDRLRDTNMQECFLHCALYREDCVIRRDELIGRFIQGELVKGNSRKEEFNQGHTILNKLVKLCLLEATDGRDFEAVKMHDLVREMALRITNDKPRYMVRAGIVSQVFEEQDWAFDLDKVSFNRSCITRIPEDMAPNCPTLSTLLLSNCYLKRIPESFFQYMYNLQVLDLSGNSELIDLPSCISNLGSLRALSLRRCGGLKSMPPLGKLKNLRVLDVNRTGIKEVPLGMENLVKLKFLDMGGIELDELPNEILPKLSQLQYLNLPLCVKARGEDLASLELLEQFGGWFWDLHNFNKFMRSHHNYEKVWGYRIFVGKAMQDYEKVWGYRIFVGKAMQDYEGFEVSIYNVRRMIIEDYIIAADGGEEAKSIILPHCIDSLEISRCQGLSSCLVDNFLSHTTSSKGLNCEISNCDDIEWIVNVSSHGIRFHSLTVHSLENLVGLCKGNIASHTFSGLTKLHIEGCPRMKKLFLRAMMQDLQNLEKLDVRKCKEMEEIIGREEGEGSSQSSNPQITSTTTHLPKLKKLLLFTLPQLTRICEGNIASDTFSGLTELYIHGCPRMMKKLFLRAMMQDLQNLEKLVVTRCDEMEEIIGREEGEGSSQSSNPQITSTTTYLPKLKELHLSYLPQLTRIYEGNIASHTFSGLMDLDIYDCPRMKKLFPRAMMQDLQNLETLRVSDCKEMEEIIGREEGEGSSQSSNPQITSTTTHLPKLKRLHLSGLPQFTRICEGKLMCDSLEEMRLEDLPNLRRLPFYTATTNGRPFPSLQKIQVEENRWETLEWEQSHLKTLFQPYVTFLN